MGSYSDDVLHLKTPEIPTFCETKYSVEASMEKKN